MTEEEGGGRERESDSDEGRREGRAKRVQTMRIGWEGSPSHLRDGDSVQCIAQKFYKKTYGSHAAPGCSAWMASPLSRINLNMNS